MSTKNNRNCQKVVKRTIAHCLKGQKRGVLVSYYCVNNSAAGLRVKRVSDSASAEGSNVPALHACMISHLRQRLVV